MKLKLYSLIIIAMIVLGLTQQKKNRIVFFGDSITQAGVGPKGYVTHIGDLMKQKSLQDQYVLLGAGISGNKVTDLFLRLDRDVISKDPAVVVIWIGVNDVWHKKGGTGTDTRTFEAYYELIIKKLQENKIKVVMCTPGVIGEKTDSTNGQDADLNRYSDIIRKLAAKNSCDLVDLRKVFLSYNLANNMENKQSGLLTSDGVHLNDKGNQVVAEEMMKVLVR